MGRRFTFNLRSAQRALIGSLFVCVCLGLDVHAQADDAQLTDAQRIEQMRDQAGQQGDAQPLTPEQLQAQLTGEADTAGEEDLLPEHPNDDLPLGPSEAGAFDVDGDTPSSGALGDGWVLSTLAALGVIIALIYGMRWLLRRGGVVSKATPSGSIVEVLSRTTVAPRSHVVLMRIGTRILIVNDSTSGMRTLASIEDPEEVADLLGALEASKANSLSQNFSGVMKKLSGQWSASDEDLDVDREDELNDGVGMDKARGVVSSVRDRLAALSGAGGKP